MRKLLPPLSGLALFPVAALAFQPLITDDTGTQGRHGNQLEASYSHTATRSLGTTATTRAFPLVFTRGVTDSLDGYIGASHTRIAPAAPAIAESGWGNVSVGLKWRFHEDDTTKRSFAIKPEVQLPVSSDSQSRGLGTGRASYGATVIITQTTGFGAVHANIAMNRVNFSTAALNALQRRSIFRLSVAPVWDLSDRWKLALDAGLTTNPDLAARSRMGYIELGAVFSPGKDIEVALAVIRSVSDGEISTTQLNSGVTWRF